MINITIYYNMEHNYYYDVTNYPFSERREEIDPYNNIIFRRNSFDWKYEIY